MTPSLLHVAAWSPSDDRHTARTSDLRGVDRKVRRGKERRGWREEKRRGDKRK